MDGALRRSQSRRSHLQRLLSLLRFLGKMPKLRSFCCKAFVLGRQNLPVLRFSVKCEHWQGLQQLPALLKALTHCFQELGGLPLEFCGKCCSQVLQPSQELWGPKLRGSKSWVCLLRCSLRSGLRTLCASAMGFRCSQDISEAGIFANCIDSCFGYLARTTTTTMLTVELQLKCSADI